MLQLVRALDVKRYTPRTYIYCTGDAMSVALAQRLEGSRTIPFNGLDGKAPDYSLLELPRARRVAQPMLSSALSSAHTLSFAVWQLVAKPLLTGPTPRTHQRDFAAGQAVKHRSAVPFDALLLNGPGTCVVIVLACYIVRVRRSSLRQVLYLGMTDIHHPIVSGPAIANAHLRRILCAGLFSLPVGKDTAAPGGPLRRAVGGGGVPAT